MRRCTSEIAHTKRAGRANARQPSELFRVILGLDPNQTDHNNWSATPNRNEPCLRARVDELRPHIGAELARSVYGKHTLPKQLRAGGFGGGVVVSITNGINGAVGGTIWLVTGSTKFKGGSVPQYVYLVAPVASAP